MQCAWLWIGQAERELITGFDFRWNHRKIVNSERRNVLLAGIGGKRLIYRDSSPACLLTRIPLCLNV
jgi:hypothetical protein